MQSPGQQGSPGAQPDVELGSCLSRDCFCIPMGSAAAWARGEELAGRALGAGPGCAPEPRARMDVGSGSMIPCQCAQSRMGRVRGGAGKSQDPGRDTKRLWSCLQNSCYASSSLSSPASSCRSILGFIASPFCYQPPISGLPLLKKGPLAGSEAPAMPANIPQESFQPPAGFSWG